MSVVQKYFLSQMRNSSFYQDYECLKLLGSGSYSTVYLVKRTKDSKPFALKQVSLDKLSQSQKNAILTEIQIMASINSPYIIGFQQSFYSTEANSICLVMEFAQDGDLQAYMRKYQQQQATQIGLPQQYIWKTVLHVLHGIKTLHDNNIVHRDLKSSNIMYSNGIAKLGDFNVSKITEGALCKSKIGTPYYTAPQIWKGELYTNRCDIWSFGCIIYEMCAFQPPFKSKNIPELFVSVLKGNYQTLPGHYSDDLRTFVRMCLVLDPKQRPSVSQLLCHPIIQIRQEWLKQQIFQSSNNVVKILKPLKCPRVHLFLNDLLRKITKREEIQQNDSSNCLSGNQKSLKGKRKAVDFNQNRQTSISPKKRGFSIKKLPHSNKSNLSSYKHIHQPSRIPKQDTNTINNNKFVIKKRIQQFRSAKNIFLEQQSGKQQNNRFSCAIEEKQKKNLQAKVAFRTKSYKRLNIECSEKDHRRNCNKENQERNSQNLF